MIRDLVTLAPPRQSHDPASPGAAVCPTLLPVPGVVLWLVLVAVWIAWTPYQFLVGGSPMTEFSGTHNPVRLIANTHPFDLLGNVVFLAPIGALIALGRRGGHPVRAALLTGALVSAGLELGQVFVTDRIVSVADLVLNTLGAGLGGALALRLRSRFGTDRLLHALFAAVFAGVLGYVLYAGYLFDRDQRLTGWDPTYEIAVGRDADGDMPYVGRVWDGLICAGDGADRVCAGPGASLAQRELLARTAERTQVVEARARVLSASDDQTGPTRIITFSPHAWLTNVTLCQWRTTLNIRFRTPFMGPNGEDFEIWLADAIHVGEPVEVRTRFSHGTVRTEIVGAGATRVATHTFDALSSGLLLSGFMLGVMPTDILLARGLTVLLLALPLLLAGLACARWRRRGRGGARGWRSRGRAPTVG